MKDNIIYAVLGLLVVSQTYTLVQFNSFKEEVSDRFAVINADPSHAGHNHAAEATKPFEQSQQAQQPAAPQGPTTTLAFAEMEKDFGKIKQDTKNKHIFKFTNTGTEPLIISNAQGSCGCTVPKYPTEPIAPGKTGEIEVEYSPGKQQGMQTKNVTITANTNPPTTMLTIKANVEAVAQ
jgi:hypothetical protein